MRDAGVPVVVVGSGRSLDNVGTLTQELADALGVGSEGQVLAQRITDEAAATRAAIKAVAPDKVQDKSRTVFLYVRGQAGVYYMFGMGSGADGLIDALGGYDVSGVDGLLDRLPAVAQTPAGQNRRIVDMRDNAILSFGPRTSDILNSLAVEIYAPESLP
jgi:iron complex transport system substrate-binding protein